ncbi:MAG: HAD family hydrolase [Chloroflexi bacterium]|nr:HAD family hydrolase [Chloroflexota bacterium]
MLVVESQPQSKIAGVLFDLDNTLVPRKGWLRRVFKEFYKATPLLRASRSEEEVCSRLIEWDNDGDVDRASLYARALKAWPEIGGTPSEWVDWETQAIGSAIEPDDEVLLFLARLREFQIPWGIVTNGGARQRLKLAAAKLDGITPFSLVSSECGMRKPEPAIFREAMRRLGLVPAETVLFVGDDPDNDIVGAQGVGMATAWVRRGRQYPHGMPAPNMLIDRVNDLRPVLLQ